jgi:hypothetical protein
MATAVPSGKFCNPMPTARATAAPREVPATPSVMPSPTAPKATPTAIPSGMLWSVMADTRSTLLRHVVWRPSASDIFIPGWRWGSTRSKLRKKKPPARNPMTGGTQTGSEPAAESSIAGAKSDQKLAAIMTPAAKPSIESRSLRGTFLVPNTKDAPAAVIPQVNIVAKSACKTGDRPAKAPTTKTSLPSRFQI